MSSKLFDFKKLLLIAGPCSLENEQICRQVATTLKLIQEKYAADLTLVFKTSFDKANRTSLRGFRGVGLEEGINILRKIKVEYHLPVTTDIHLPEQAEKVATVCDAIQIPAFLCRQTDLLEAAAKTNCAINVKKGQFLSPFDMQFVAEKLRYFGAKEIWLTERGASFGYNNLVVDMRSFQIMKATGCPVIFDATHSLQSPGNGAGVTGGDRRYLQNLAQAALAAGAQGLFVETHPNPEAALSDKATQLPLAQLEGALEKWLQVWKLVKTFHEDK